MVNLPLSSDTSGRRTHFSNAVKSAAAHLQFAQKMFVRRVPPIHLIPPLRRGFHSVQTALHILAARPGEPTTTQMDSSLAEITVLSRQQLEQLAHCYRRYQTGVLEPVSRKQLKPYLRALNVAVQSLRLWDRNQRVRPNWQRVLISPIYRPVVVMSLLGLALMASVIYRELPPDTQGLRATFFSDTTFSTPVGERIDSEINFRWGKKAPIPQMPNDHFSVRWEGFLIVKDDEKRLLSAGADDGVRVYVNNRLWVNNPGPHQFQSKRASKPIGPGEHIIRVEFVEFSGAARAALSWSTPNGYWETIPSHRLRPAPLRVGIPDRPSK